MRLLFRGAKRVFFRRAMGAWSWPKGVDHAGWARMTVPSPSGGSLACLHGLATTRPQAIVVLAHPLRRTAKGHWLTGGQADWLRSAGYDVVLFDFNGFGESTSGNFDYPSDIIAVGKVARKLRPRIPVVLFGASFGAGFGLCALADEEHPFSCAILESPFLTLQQFWRANTLASALLWLLELLMPRIARRLNPERAAKRVRYTPDVMLLVGAQDDKTPASIGATFAETMQLTAFTELVVFPEAGHLDAQILVPERYRNRILRFLSVALPDWNCKPHASIQKRMPHAYAY